jgi:non-specific serine/threonine protein kinase/serine/threonine-protein kinase
MALLEQGKLAEAEPFCREALEKSRHGIGDDHPDTLGKMGTMTALLKAQGKFAEAEVLGREQLERLRRVLGDDHATTRTSIYNLGYLLRAQGKLAEAEPLCRESMERYRRILGDDDPRALTTIQSMGTLLVETERHGEAVALLSATEAAARRTFTGDSADRLASYLLALGKAQAGLARPPDLATAEAKLLEAHAIASAGRGSTHETARACAKALVELYGVWHAAEPGSGRDRQRAEWQAKLDSLPRIRK